MDEDIAIINKNTRNEKIKNFFVNNTKKLIIAISAIVLIIFGYFIYEDLKKKNKIKLANRYNLVTIKFISGDKNKLENELIDIINETSLEEEIKNLVIYKKALFNSDFESENNLIQILSPVINSDSVWRSHALYLMAEYFYYKNQKQKSKDFFNQILTLENSNPNIRIETQKRLNRDFSD